MTGFKKKKKIFSSSLCRELHLHDGIQQLVGPIF